MKSLGKIAITALTIIFCNAAIAEPPAELIKGPKPNDLVGLWMPSEGTSYIKIFKEKGVERYHGRVVWLKNPLDEQGNPRKDPEGKMIMNMLNLRNFIFEDGEWVDGTIYDPKSGNTYYCAIEMKGNNKLEVRGSLDPFGLVGRTDTWVRMKTK